jgi:threonine/homoserine/homoserine lactone efflux protein
MSDIQSFLLYFAAALLIALTPGPGIFYVAARTLAGGAREGLASSLGTGLGGLVHVVAGAVGVSTLLMASADAFTLLKLVGAAYLVWLGVKTIRDAGLLTATHVDATGTRRAFRDGVVVEAFNPKTAAFFLAFIPQFIDPAHSVALQFVLLGLVSVGLNTLVDVGVTFATARARASFSEQPHWIKRLRLGSGVVLCGLGASLLLVRRSQ